MLSRLHILYHNSSCHCRLHRHRYTSSSFSVNIMLKWEKKNPSFSLIYMNVYDCAYVIVYFDFYSYACVSHLTTDLINISVISHLSRQHTKQNSVFFFFFVPLFCPSSTLTWYWYWNRYQKLYAFHLRQMMTHTYNIFSFSSSTDGRGEWRE